MAKRIYLTYDPDTDTRRLVRAHSQAQAVRHVASRIRVQVATQQDLVDMLGRQGSTVEEAGEESAEASE